MTALAAVHPQPPHPGRSAALMLLSCAVHGLLLWALVQYSLQPTQPWDELIAHAPKPIQIVVITAPQAVPQPLLSPVVPAVSATRAPAAQPKALAPAPEPAPQAAAQAPPPILAAAPSAAAAQATAAPVAMAVGADKPRAVSPPEKPAEAPLVQGHPDYAYNPPPDYPMALREQGLGGVVWLRVWVDSEGHPGEIKLAKGSGYRLLDDAALRAVRSWRFVPARMGEQRQASWVEFPIRFTANG